MNPDLERTPQYAAMTAGWYWATHNSNALAEAQDWIGLTKKINGGIIGLEDRVKHTNEALAVF
jgi:putative chitinase